MYDFNLQRFADDDFVDVATLKDHFTDDDLQGFVTTTPEEPNKESEQQLSEATESELPTEPEPAADGVTVSKHVPYERFKEVNDKYKALKAELEAIKKQVQQPQVQQPYQPPEQQYQPYVQQPRQLTVEEIIAKRADEEARKRAGIPVGVDVDDFSWQVTEPAKYRAYLKEVAKAEMRLEQEFYEQQRTYQENLSFVYELRAKPNFDVLYNFAMAELDELPGREARPLAKAIERLDMGQASKDDLDRIRKFVAHCEEKLNKINNPAAVQQPVFPQQQSKLQQVANLPRANQLNTGGKATTMTWAQVEDLIRQNKFDQIPKEMIAQIDPKLLE